MMRSSERVVAACSQWGLTLALALGEQVGTVAGCALDRVARRCVRGEALHEGDADHNEYSVHTIGRPVEKLMVQVVGEDGVEDEEEQHERRDQALVSKY